MIVLASAAPAADIPPPDLGSSHEVVAYIALAVVLALVGLLVWLLKSSFPAEREAERKERKATAERHAAALEVRDARIREDADQTRAVLEKVAESMATVGSQLAVSREATRSASDGCAAVTSSLVTVADSLTDSVGRINHAAQRITDAASEFRAGG